MVVWFENFLLVSLKDSKINIIVQNRKKNR